MNWRTGYRLLLLTLAAGALGCSQRSEEIADHEAVTLAAPAAATPAPAGAAVDKAVAASPGNHSDMPMVTVPAGNSSAAAGKPMTRASRNNTAWRRRFYLDRHPQHKLFLPAFKIDVYEVSNKQFKEFIITTDRALPYEWGRTGMA